METSGFSGRYDRIMQFAGQRTDESLNPVGEPDNFLIKMTPDVLPQPDAVLVHGISPQKTISEGISEAQFCRYLTSQVSAKDTIFVGYNNVRFDNEFIRFTLWRNFYDAYEWSWKDNCSILDLLDVVRMTRALRPEGIKWPFAPDGKPSNKLEYLSSINGLDHADAHDALSDVHASLGVARLLKEKQPKLFNYLLEHRKKDKIIPLVESGKPVVYTSGRYPVEFNKTALAVMIGKTEDGTGALMYDLRIDPNEFKDLTASELSEKWAARGEDAAYFPVKVLKYNRCPAVAPEEVLKKENGYENLKIHHEIAQNHLVKLRNINGFDKKLRDALEAMWPKKQSGLVDDIIEVDNQLYDGFIPNSDKELLQKIQTAEADLLDNIPLKDPRLKLMLHLYKARNYPKHLSIEEQMRWDDFRYQKLVKSGYSARYFKRLEELAKTPGLDGEKNYLLEELILYAQLVLPVTSDTPAVDVG